MDKIYYTYDQLKKDLPGLRNTEIFVISEFDKTINLKTEDYKSLLAQIKRQNIKIQVIKEMINSE